MTRIAYRFLLHALALLVLYALASLIAALKFLPGDVTQTSLPYNQISGLAATLLDLAILSGLLGGGIYALRPLDQSGESRILRIAALLWSLLAVVTVAAGALDLLTALTPVLVILKVAVILLVITGIAPHIRAWTPIPLVWSVGMVLSAGCALISLYPTDDYLLAALLSALASGVTTYIAYVLAALALAYWLMHRFSDITPLWADMSLSTVAGLLALAGALVTLPTLGVEIGWIGTLIIAVLYLIAAAHSYYAFSHRNPTETLAAHWTALGVLLLLLGVGVLGALQAPLRAWTAGTRLSDLQPTLALLGVVAIILGVCNQAAAEMRGQNRRVTGLAPFWLVAFGTLGGGLALAGAGLVQVYLERLLSVGYLDVQALVEPLYTLWILGLVGVALGVSLYTLIFWLRRPSNKR